MQEATDELGSKYERMLHSNRQRPSCLLQGLRLILMVLMSMRSFHHAVGESAKLTVGTAYCPDGDLKERPSIKIF